MLEERRPGGGPDDGAEHWRRRIARWLARPLSLVAIASAVVLFLLLHPKTWGPINWAFGRGLPRRSMLPALVAAATFAALPLLYRFLRSEAAAVWRRLAVLIALGIGLQWSLIVAEGRGTRTMADAVWRAGHAEFIRTAQHQDLTGLVGRYEELARQHRWQFARSKPPGCLVVYEGIVALADSPVGAVLAQIYAAPPAAAPAQRDWRVEGVILTLFPLFTALTIIPLFFLARDLVGPRAAGLAALFYIAVPSVLTIVVHLDSALYPLVGATAAALTSSGTRRGSAWRVAAGGAVLSAGVFVSFSLLPIVPLIGALPLILSMTGERDEPWPRRARRGVVLAAWWAAGLVGFHLIPVLALDYDVITRYRDAMAFHEQWWPDDPRWLLGSPVQFFVWIGVPVTTAILVEAVHAAHPRRVWSAASLFLLVALVLVAITNAIGHTRAEADRLWLFWAPLLMVAAAARIDRWEADGGPRVVPVLLAIQLITAFILKIHFTY
jgi:hypothetical protein